MIYAQLLLDCIKCKNLFFYLNVINFVGKNCSFFLLKTLSTFYRCSTTKELFEEKESMATVLQLCHFEHQNMPLTHLAHYHHNNFSALKTVWHADKRKIFCYRYVSATQEVGVPRPKFLSGFLGSSQSQLLLFSLKLCLKLTHKF